MYFVLIDSLTLLLLPPSLLVPNVPFHPEYPSFCFNSSCVLLSVLCVSFRLTLICLGTVLL